MSLRLSQIHQRAKRCKCFALLHCFWSEGTRARTHTHILYLPIYVFIYKYIHIHMYIHAYIHTYIHTCMHACMHRYLHIEGADGGDMCTFMQYACTSNRTSIAMVLRTARKAQTSKISARCRSHADILRHVRFVFGLVDVS